MKSRLIALFLALTVTLSATGLSAATHEARVPLHDGKLRVSDLSAILLRDLHLPAVKLPAIKEIDLAGLSGNLFIHALNVSLGDGWHVSTDRDALILRCDPDKLPHNLTQTKRVVRLFTATAAPEATAAQHRSYGLLFPQPLVEGKPLVILIHGLDCDGANWAPMANLLIDAGYQVASFSYPADQPIAESAALLQEHLDAVRQAYPNMTLDLIGHSMGGLVARAYIEGKDYAGGVRHLILIAPPNHGSSWARLQPALELVEHYHLWKHDAEWRMTWMITDGLGEAGSELKPNSQFIKDLNAGPRRAGVQYTVIAGNHSPIAQIGAKCIEAPANWVPRRAENWWGIRQTRAKLQQWGQNLKHHQGKTDGPVAINSAKLDGVNDFVTLPADHTALYCPTGDTPPAAWDVIRDRLSR